MNFQNMFLTALAVLIAIATVLFVIKSNNTCYNLTICYANGEVVTIHCNYYNKSYDCLILDGNYYVNLDETLSVEVEEVLCKNSCKGEKKC